VVYLNAMERIDEDKIKVHIYTVSELTESIKGILEESLPPVWVEGEVSNLRVPTSGHVYFDLKDEKSLIHVVLFRKYKQNLQFELENGLKVIVFGNVTVYPPKGEYQIVAQLVEPKGLGELQLAFEQLKRKLAEEGLFDEAFKKPIPLFPRKIGVVTSPTGAAIRDILNVINRRFSRVHIIIYPVRVQGKEAPYEIANAIRRFNKDFSDIDVIIVGRGGGSIEDLWAFNEEVVARAIFASEIPVISAVGHEIDYVISDFVADLRAPTPSAAAELVVRELDAVLERLSEFDTRLTISMDSLLRTSQERFENFLKHPAFRRVEERVREYVQMVDDIFGRMVNAVAHTTAIYKERLSALSGRLNALSPLAILERGYAVVRKLPERKLLYDVSALNVGDEVEVRLHKGEFVSRVEKIRGEKA